MSRLRAFAELLRLPNVFTAMADICLGGIVAVVAGTPWSHWPTFLFVLASSSCLYCAGMVWNDFFDVDQDRRERPFRPLPSGRISSKEAAWAGTLLMLAGLALAILGGMRGEVWHVETPILSVILALAILLYDALLKRTWAGPLAMGACRALNVLLGLSLADQSTLPWSIRIHLSLVVGLYIVGLTWFARTEARTSSRNALRAAAVLTLLAFVLALALPAWGSAGSSSVFFPYLLVGLGFLIGMPALRAIAKPSPALVQAAVKRALVGLVVLDAVLATALTGLAGLLILILILPTLYLGQWLYST